MINLKSIFSSNKEKATLTKDEIAKILKTNTTALEAFEKSYQENILDNPNISDNFFDVNAKQASDMRTKGKETEASVESMIDRIVNELLATTKVYSYDGESDCITDFASLPDTKPVTTAEIKTLPIDLRPQLTGTLIQKQLQGESYEALIANYQAYLKTKDPKLKKNLYQTFRYGLDSLDLDGITYEMIDQNPTSMGHWLPQLVQAVKKSDGFFKIPKTEIIKVPLPLLQLTRLDYETLTPTTIQIVDRFCQKVFGLDEENEYFIKTGTYSSKFDFRNAYVHGAKEVRELGEYLLFIHYQALRMASPLVHPHFYGVSTTVEWCCREFIPDKERNPQIYKGLPLHTEYRLFVDFDADYKTDGSEDINRLYKESGIKYIDGIDFSAYRYVIGIHPYWDPDVMKQRFGHEEDSNSPHQIHDYIIYKSHEELLMKRYEENKKKICDKMEEVASHMQGLSGQWSVDVMQNGDDFYIIDMAPAMISAFHDCVPKDRLKEMQENWLPDLSQ